MRLTAYDIRQSYDWNYAHAPEVPPDVAVPDCPGDWNFCGIATRSPLGIPAGPLLNSRWIHYYAGLGFDVLTYKTVRSGARACYEPPNLLPVESAALGGEGRAVTAAADSRSWAISFGMPSKDPAVWRADVERARRGLGPGQVLVVSVVASPQPGWTLEQVAADFAQCARWAAGAGAQTVEANLSCPNVCTQEADLFLSAEASGLIARAVREAVPQLPLILKIGLFQNRPQAEALVQAVAPYATALSTTNSITATVRSPDGQALFGGLRRGIGGAAIAGRCLEELRMLAAVIRERRSPLRLIAVGGVSTAEDVRLRLEAGAHHVQMATAAMLDPLAAVPIRRGRLAGY
ncbi:MAG: dihydroorotate dehydrogenase [Candidatus Solibacter usitatus]|nr:dihydroorotate dehydrogenase [Candidatus Solibacter usitatus]